MLQWWRRLRYLRMKPTKLIEFRISKKNDGELSDTICYECQFCNKIVLLDDDTHRMCECITGKHYFFCHFCIRHGFTNDPYILMLSFRGIIGHYYYNHYLKNRMYLSQIHDMIEMHKITGLMNPVFSYDSETYMWFVDFSKVGLGKNQLILDDVLSTMEPILECFELDDYLGSNFDPKDIIDQLMEAANKFYTDRYLPPFQKQIIPTIQGIGDPKPTDEEIELAQKFIAENLLLI